LPVNIPLNVELQQQLRARLWRDDLARMPRQLYPDRSEAELYELWQPEYELLFGENLAVTDAALHLFAPATAAEMRPRYLAGAAENWYALVTLRYNRRSNYRFCYVRYWWAADKPALREMVQTLLAAWPAVPFDWLKFRLGYHSTLAPTDFHAEARWQTYMVAGRPKSHPAEWQQLASALPHLVIEAPLQVDERWWRPYQALLDEQEQLAPGLMEEWHDYETARLALRPEMTRLLQNGGGVVNLWQAERLVGHISWLPHSYREQLIRRCWHINNVIVAPPSAARARGKSYTAWP
jgi:hypothetical protein